MKKSLRYLFAAILAVTATLFTVIALAACNTSGELTGLKIENAKVMFRVGDEFELGEDFTVYALYADGSQVDVTSEINKETDVRKENGFDMNVAGDYNITVVYGGKKEVYTIYVDEFDPILRKIDLDTSEMKSEFTLGDDVAFPGLTVVLTYENAQGVLISTESTSLRDFSVEVKDENGNTIKDFFTDFGTYTVTVSKTGIKASFTVEVNDIDVSTVQGALYAGNAFRSKIVSGKQTDYSAIKTNPLHVNFSYDYAFGDNYTYYHETTENPDNEFHLSMIDDEIFCVHLQANKIVANGSLPSSMMQGPPNLLWYNMSTYYGIENTLTLLYSKAKVCTNGDLKETVDEAKRKYTFSFSGLEMISNTYHFFETEVTFTLGEDYYIETVDYTQKFYENNELLQDQPGYSPTFTTDENGKTVGNTVTYTVNVKVEQTAGERTAENPYDIDMFRFSSYDLVLDTLTLEENPVIECNAGDRLTIKILNCQPDLATFNQDPMYLNYEGNYGGYVDGGTILTCDGFIVFRANDILYSYLDVTIVNGGTWKLYVKTANILRTITFVVTGEKPTSMTSQLMNDASGAFYSGNKKTLAVNGTAYFYGQVNKYANEAQTATVTSTNNAYATIEKVTVNGVDCFKFTASAAGTYTVTVSSDVCSVSCSFTFTVSEMPDYASILAGTYTTTDYMGNIYEVEFTPAAATDDDIRGSVTVKMTPTENDGTPITSSTATQTLTYSVDFDNMAIGLTNVSGTNLGIGLEVNANGQFVLKDKYNDSFVLVKE